MDYKNNQSNTTQNWDNQSITIIIETTNHVHVIYTVKDRVFVGYNFVSKI